jgi:hypothetical protein
MDPSFFKQALMVHEKNNFLIRFTAAGYVTKIVTVAMEPSF